MYFFEFRIPHNIRLLTAMNVQRYIIEHLSVIPKYRPSTLPAYNQSAFSLFLLLHTKMRRTRRRIARLPFFIFGTSVFDFRSAVFTIRHLLFPHILLFRRKRLDRRNVHRNIRDKIYF